MAAGQVDVLTRDFYKYSKRQYYHYRDDSRDVEFGRGRDHSRTRDWGSRKDGFGGRHEEQKVEELSKGDEVADYEDWVRLPVEKKRKFSPVLWDRVEKNVRISSKNRVVAVAPLSPPPPRPSPPSSDGIIKSMKPKQV